MSASSVSASSVSAGLLASSGALVTALFVVTATAHAQRIDDAQRAYRAAEYPRALELLDAAEASTTLSRDDAVTLYVLRALVYRAQGAEEDRDLAIVRLAHLAPDLRLGEDIPPDLREQLRAAQANVHERIGVEARAERSDGSVTVRAAVQNDIAGLATGFRVHARIAGGAWQETASPELRIDAAAAEPVEYWAEVTGPGGATLVSAGSASAPRVAAAIGDAAETVPAGEDLSWLAWAIPLGAAVVVAAVVIGIVLSPNDTTGVECCSFATSGLRAPLVRF
ncbi:MAG: hypothetical protein AB7P00_26270 [Sandaracinaceae bacterium]